MLRLAVCDDNQAVLDKIKALLDRHYEKEIRTELFTNTFSLETYLVDKIRGNIDVLIMDINIGEENGIMAAKNIQEKYPHIKIIFLTAYINYATEIFKVEPVYFLVKPIDAAKVYEAVDKAMDMIQNEQENAMMVNFRGEILKVRFSSIMFMESDRHVVKINTFTNTLTTSKKIADFLEELPENFCRCHQSYIVNMDKINKFSVSGIELNNGVIIPVSRNRYKESKEQFMSYLGGKL